MFRVVSISTVLLLSVLAGCRGAPPRAPIAPRAEVETVTNAGATQRKRRPTDVRTVGFREQNDEIVAVPPDVGRPEALPIPVDEAFGPSLTLLDLEGVALGNNPTLAAARSRIAAAQGTQLQAGLYPNPVAGYYATQIGNLGTAGQQGGIVSQRIITGGKLGLDQAIAGREVEAARFQLQAQQQRVLSDVRVRFYETLVAQRRVELTSELAAIGDELVRATEKLLTERLGTENDLLQAQVRAGESDILFDNARNRHVEAWRRLAAVAGVPNMQLTLLAGELGANLPNFDWKSCYAVALRGNPELNVARTKVQRARISLERARREPIPNVDVSVSVRHDNATSDDVTNVQLGVPLPVFDRNQGNIRRAQAEWFAARADVERTELELQDRLAVAYRRYANARQQVERYGGQIVPKAQQSLELVSAGYEQGQVEYLTLLTAQETFLRASLSYLDSLQELWSAAAVIEGQLLTGSLEFNGP